MEEGPAEVGELCDAAPNQCWPWRHLHHRASRVLARGARSRTQELCTIFCIFDLYLISPESFCSTLVPEPNEEALRTMSDPEAATKSPAPLAVVSVTNSADGNTEDDSFRTDSATGARQKRKRTR